MGRAGIRSAYATGKGKVIVRARAEIIEDEKTNRSKIIVSELPYQVNKARLIEHIADLVKEKRIEGISNIDDHSDRNGMHIVIDVKRDASPQIVLNYLYSYTQMQSTFGVNMLAIVGATDTVPGMPKVLNLHAMLQEYIKFQLEVITRRTEFELNKAKERAHILKGLVIALDNIDEVIALLRAAKSIPEGKEQLMAKFDLDDVQAQAIVQMRLGQLTGLERDKIEAELAELKIKIDDMLDILANEGRRLAIIKDEAIAIRDKFGDERRTEIAAVSGEVDIEDLIPQEECVLTMTNFGYVKRMKADTYKTQRRGGRGISGMTRREEDVATELFVINSHDYVMFFSDRGRVYRIKCYEVPEASRTGRGMNIMNLLPLQQDENITSMIRISHIEEEGNLVMITKNGIIKRVPLSAYSNVRKNGLIAINLDEDDVLTRVRLTSGDDDLIVATKKGKVIRFNEQDLRILSRIARGVKALKLRKDDHVIGMSVIRDDTYVLTVSETGYGRLSPTSDYPVQKRGGQGRLNYHVEKYGDVAAIKIVDLDDDIILISENGIIIRIAAETIRICARPAKGVKVMRIEDDNRVVTLARVPHEDDEVDDVEIEDDGTACEGEGDDEIIVDDEIIDDDMEEEDVEDEGVEDEIKE